MNRILLSAVIILSSLTAFAGKNDITIKGTITNQLSEEVEFSYISYDGNWLNFKQHQITEQLDEQGMFIVTLPLSNAYTQLYIQNGNEATEIYASPGDKIIMTVDAADFDNSLKYEGVGMKATVANFMAKHVLEMGMTQSFHRECQKLMAIEPDYYVDSLNKRIQKEINFLIDNSAGLPQSFIKFWDALYEYTKYDNMLTYPYMHEIVKAQSYDVGETPIENYAVVKQVPEKFDDRNIGVSSYRSYISSYYSQQLSAQKASDNDKMLELSHQKMPASSEEYVFAHYIQSHVKGSSLQQSENYLTIFTSRYPGSSYTKTLQGLIEKKRKLSIGSPAIDFTVSDAEGKKIKLSELKGKVVYLDFWASWCGPCKAQFPHVSKIKEHFAGKDVVFVYVSIDEDVDAYEKAMEKYHLTGLHTREDGGWKSKTAQEYGVQGIPAYFLIDREGNFASENTPRPSQGEALIKAIEALL